MLTILCCKCLPHINFSGTICWQMGQHGDESNFFFKYLSAKLNQTGSIDYLQKSEHFRVQI